MPTPQTLKTQALLVTSGPFEGRICENDDDDFVFADDFSSVGLDFYEHLDMKLRVLEDDGGIDEELKQEELIGIDCEIVTFGYYLFCRGHHYIPGQFLRPANMADLVKRHREVSEIVGREAWIPDGDPDHRLLIDVLLEKNYIVDEIWSRENLARLGKSGSSMVFLCHASEDKHFVRQVCNDLANAGHKIWIDEFEIKVGDSIVDKIDSATAEADSLVLFISKSALESEWVKREWQSALARSLSGSGTKVLPALIEECDAPSLLADIKFANFVDSYRCGLDELMEAIP